LIEKNAVILSERVEGPAFAFAVAFALAVAFAFAVAFVLALAFLSVIPRRSGGICCSAIPLNPLPSWVPRVPGAGTRNPPLLSRAGDPIPRIWRPGNDAINQP